MVNIAASSEKTRSQAAELGANAKTMRAPSAHAGNFVLPNSWTALSYVVLDARKEEFLSLEEATLHGSRLCVRREMCDPNVPTEYRRTGCV